MFIPPYRISLSGGGMKGLAHIGALEALHKRGHLRAVKEYLGISAGALVAFCLSLGCTLAELRMVAALLDFGLVRHLDPEAILAFPESYGLDTGVNLDKLLSAVLRAKGLSADITFQELAEAHLGPTLRVYAADINTCEDVELSAAASPTVPVRLGVRASMSIPIYFTPVRHPETGHMLVDGGVINNTPFKFITDDERITTLSITFADTHKHVEEVESLPMFLKQLYYAVHHRYNKELHADKDHQVLYIDCGRFNAMNFEATQEEKMDLMLQGRRSAEAFLARFGEGGGAKGERLMRRKSVV